MGHNPGALADFTASLKIDPNNQATYFNRGIAYYVIGGRTPDAEADFSKAIELDPKDAYAAIWLDLAARRNNAASRLREQSAQLDMTAWPAPVIREFLGEFERRPDACRCARQRSEDQPGTKLRSQFLQRRVGVAGEKQAAGSADAQTCGQRLSARLCRSCRRHGGGDRAALGRVIAWSMIRKSMKRFSLATNAKRLRGDHAQT